MALAPIRVAASAILIFSGFAFAADKDNWRSKPPAEWSIQDAQSIISFSPWAVPTRLKYGNYLMPQPGSSLPPTEVAPPHFNSIVQTPESRLPPLAPTETFIPLVGIGTPPQPTDLYGRPSKGPPPPVAPGKVEVMVLSMGTALVLWDSGLPVREAKTRLGIPDTVSRLAEKSYVVSVFGYPYLVDQPVSKDVKALVLESAILMRKGKPSIHATEVEIIGYQNVSAMRYFFPAKEAIQAGDNEVVFHMQIGLKDIVDAKFNLKNMMFEGHLAVSDYSATTQLLPPSAPVQPNPPETAVTGPIGELSERRKNADRLLEHALMLGEKNQLDAAAQELRQVLQLTPNNPKAHYNLAIDLGMMKDIAGAISEYRETIRLMPNHIRAIENLASLLDDQGDHQEAIGLYRDALRFENDKASLHYNLGLTLFRVGDERAAHVELEECIRLDPDHANAHFHLGRIFERKGALQDAIAHYREALALQPGAAPIHFYLGRLLWDSGEPDEALNELRAATTLAPENTAYQKKYRELKLELKK